MTIIKIASYEGFFLSTLTEDGRVVAMKEGSVPPFLADHRGNLCLQIDVATGTILNWKTPASSEIVEYYEDGEDLEDEDLFDDDDDDDLDDEDDLSYIQRVASYDEDDLDEDFDEWEWW